MKTEFIALSTEKGLVIPGPMNKAMFNQCLKQNMGKRFRIMLEHEESNKQRRFFEGAVVPLLTFYQEGMDHHNRDDLHNVREGLKMEFNPQLVVLGGKATKIAGSTKYKLQEGFLEKVIDWMTDQGYQTELLNPAEFKYWRDTIRPYGGPDNYVDYLLETNKIQKI